MPEKSKVPSRWDFEVRVVTPDHQILVFRQTLSPSYMDWSLMEQAIDSAGISILRSLDKRGYFN